MDMQDKLIIHHKFEGINASPDNSVEIDLNTFYDGDIVFSFREDENVYIELQSEKNTIIELDCLSYKKDDSFFWCDNRTLKIDDNGKYIISLFDSDDICYRASQYEISIITNNTKRCCYFEVLYKKEVTSDGMFNVIEMINNFINGLSIDFLFKTPINNISTNKFDSNFYIYEILCLQENVIRYHCENIINKINSNIESKIVLSKKDGKQNLASIRKNLIKSQFDGETYSLKKNRNYNNNENIILKKYLMKIINILNENCIDVNSIIKNKKKKIIDLEAMIDFENEVLTHAQSSFDKSNANNHKKSLKNEIDLLNKEMEKFILWEEAFNKSLKSIRNVLTIEEMLEISINNQISYSPYFFSNNDYKYFYDLYKGLINHYDNEHQKNKTEFFSDKKSFLLFEIYGFVLLQNILKELGFQVVNDFDSSVFTSFKSGSTFNFTNESNYRIQINYDFFCKKYTSSLANIGDLVNMNSTNCKPDYIIKVFENDKIKNVLILEIKYRNLQRMTAELGGSTETDKTIEDYFQLRYKKSKTGKPISIINHVMILFPSKHEKVFTRKVGEFLGINVEIDFADSIAYAKMKDNISRAIFNNDEE